MRIIFQQTRSEELHLDEHVTCSYLSPYGTNQSAESALLGPMSSDQGNTLTHALVAEPYSSSIQLGTCAYGSSAGRLILRKPRYVFSGVLPDGTGRGRETHLHQHDYTRLPVASSDELGGFSTSLGLFASPSLILSTESVVAMVWKGMSTSVATRAACCS